MARGRMLNTTIAKDKKLNALSIEAEYVYLKAIPHLDRDGLINGDPSLIWSDICPRRTELAPKMQDLINEIVASGLAIAYHCDLSDDTVLFFVGFSKNNTGMHYGREAKSQFDPPPGFRRTNTGLKPDGEPDEIESNDNTQNTNTNDELHECSESPDLIRTLSGPCPGEDQDQDQIEGKERDRACETSGANDELISPSFQTDEYMPGLPDPRKNKRNESAERFMEAKKLGVQAEQYRLLVDALLLGFGKKSLVDAGNDKALHHAQAVTLEIMGMSKNFRTVEGLQSIFESWYKTDWRGKKGDKPTSDQLKEHASAIADGVVGPVAPEKPAYISPLKRMQIFDGRELA